MLGISRWTDKGGSYRSIQRFFNSPIAWARVNWCFIRHHLLEGEEAILIAGDETVVTKAGKKSYGLDRFFSSLYGKPVPGLSFFSLSLISVKRRQSYPGRVNRFQHLYADLQQQVWDIYHAPNPDAFRQQVADFQTWAAENLTGTALEAVEKLVAKREAFILAFDYPQSLSHQQYD
jgi:hypothetical protein